MLLLLHVMQLQFLFENNTVPVPFYGVAVSLLYCDMGTGINRISYLMTLLFILGVCRVKPSPTIAGCVHPSLGFKPWMAECCWPTLANRYFSQNPFLLWQSPRPYFSCQFTSRPGVSQLAFLNHYPQPESHGAFDRLSNFNQKKLHLSPCAKRAMSHMHIKFLMHGRATKDCVKRKDQRTKLSFSVLIWCFEGKLGKVRSSISNVLANNESAPGFVLCETAAALGKIYLSFHSVSLSHIDFCLQTLIDESTHTASEANQDNLSKVRSQESDNLSQTHLYVCAARHKLLPTPDGPYFLSEEWNVAAFEAHRANKTQWVTTCGNLLEKDIMTSWHALEYTWIFFSSSFVLKQIWYLPKTYFL